MEEILNATVGQLVGGSIGILFLVSLFIEITPIKWNPISSFLGWIGRHTNRELDEHIKRTNKELDCRIDKLEEKVEEISKRQEKDEAKSEEQEAINSRIRILRFSDEIRRGLKHSQESFDQTLLDVTTYKQYCDTHPKFENEKAVHACERVKKEYDRCMDEDDFL
jgi:TolA-binding protein